MQVYGPMPKGTNTPFGFDSSRRRQVPVGIEALGIPGATDTYGVLLSAGKQVLAPENRRLRRRCSPSLTFR